jgi:uncharacterized membrane-anchored protein YitT (DUF2179 family)
MRFLVGLFLIVLLTYITSWITPWWWAAVFYAALVGLALQMNSWLSFFCGFTSTSLLWFVLLYFKNNANQGMFLDKMKGVLGLGIENDIYFLLIVAAIGGLLSGLGMLSGKLLRDIISGPVEPVNKRTRRRKRR